ncbi:MAG: hypothetical protein AAF125_12000, partial [Chloroflexota bacterium]
MSLSKQQTAPPLPDAPKARPRTTLPPLEVDRQLPAWARRSNPVIRRALGKNWKTLFPDVGLVTRVMIVQAVLLLVLPVHLVMGLLLPLAVLSVIAIPLIPLLYLRVVASAITLTAAEMANTRTGHTLDLLRVSLVPLDHILLGKVAAGLWRRMDDLKALSFLLMLSAIPV